MTDAEIPQQTEEQAADTASQKLIVFWSKCLCLCYYICYTTGMHTIRAVRMLMRRLRPAAHAVYALTDKLVLRHLRDLRAEAVRFAGGFPLAAARVRQATERHLLLGVLQALQLPVLAFRRHRRGMVTVLNLAAPLAAIAVLVTTVHYWSGTTFALRLEYDGQSIGYIADESVFDTAVGMAEDSVIRVDGGATITRQPRLTLAVVPEDEILDEAAVCDKLLSSSADSIVQLSGLYVDGEFIGAVLSREWLQSELDAVLERYKTGNSNETTQFVRHVEIVDGLYAISAITESSTLHDWINGTAENGTLNLQVQLHRIEVYTEEVPYASITVEDTSKYIGYRGIKTAGVPGSKQITAEVVYLDGVEQTRTVLSESIVKQPVTEEIAIGAYRVSPEAKPGVATGEFLWPLPSCRTIWSEFGGRWGRNHNGVDISGNGVYGKDILAADGGRVVSVNKAGYGGGYGLFVLIDHGNGYSTMYAHCSEVLVSVGDVITKGQLIARVGNTGQSYGAHLHFEIRYNGVAQNPRQYY